MPILVTTTKIKYISYGNYCGCVKYEEGIFEAWNTEDRV